MKRSRTAFLTVLFCAGLLGPAYAHVNLVNPMDGETFMPGGEIIIAWEVEIPHNQENWDLYYSLDGGTTWEAIALDLPVEQLTYRWTALGMEAEHVILRVVQDNAGYDYDDRSTVTISAIATELEQPDQPLETPTVSAAYPNPFTTATTLDFTLPRAEHVSVDVFDVRGVNVETLMDRGLAAGQHRLTWMPAHRASGLYLYRIAVGDYIMTTTVLRAR